MALVAKVEAVYGDEDKVITPMRRLPGGDENIARTTPTRRQTDVDENIACQRAFPGVDRIARLQEWTKLLLRRRLIPGSGVHEGNPGVAYLFVTTLSPMISLINVAPTQEYNKLTYILSRRKIAALPTRGSVM